MKNDFLYECPNMCFNGHVKYYPDKTRALFMMKSCKFCKGKGKVNRKEFDKIKKEL